MRFFTVALAALFAGLAAADCTPGETNCGAGREYLESFYMCPVLT